MIPRPLLPVRIISANIAPILFLNISITHIHKSLKSLYDNIFPNLYFTTPSIITISKKQYVAPIIYGRTFYHSQKSIDWRKRESYYVNPRTSCLEKFHEIFLLLKHYFLPSLLWIQPLIGLQVKPINL